MEYLNKFDYLLEDNHYVILNYIKQQRGPVTFITFSTQHCEETICTINEKTKAYIMFDVPYVQKRNYALLTQALRRKGYHEKGEKQ